MSDVAKVVVALTQLSSTDASAVVATLQQEGLLDRLSQSFDRHGDSPAGAKALRRFAETMRQKLDADAQVVVAQSMRRGGEKTRSAFIDVVSHGASVQSRIDLVRAAADSTTDETPAPGRLETSFGVSTDTRFESDGDATSVADIISSLSGQDAADALSLLSAEQRAAVYQGAANVREVTVLVPGAFGHTQAVPSHETDVAGLTALIDAVGSIPDRETRAQYLGELLTALGLGEGTLVKTPTATDRGMPLGRAVSMPDRATAANRVMQHLDDQTLSMLSADAVTILAEGLAQTPGGPTAALRELRRSAPTPQRDALARTIFLKTPQRAFVENPQLVEAVSMSLAAGLGGEASARAEPLRAALSTANGRAMLVDDNIPGAARLWAAEALLNGSTAAQEALSNDAPWEAKALLEAHARSRTQQFATRGDGAIDVSGHNIDNLIGSGLQAPMRPDLPTAPGGLAQAQAEAVSGDYNFYENIEVVRKVAGDPNDKPPEGIRGAAKQMEAESIRVATLPIQFSSQTTGPIDLQLYRVEGDNGQERFVDNIGRIYASFEDWRTENELPPGKMTFPADGHLGEPGQTKLVTQNTPNVSDTFWEHVIDVADVAALAGGVVASGVIIAASYGAATPAVAAAWAMPVALGSAGYMGLREGAALYDRKTHGQTLALDDPDARAAWLSLAGSGLTIVGAGAMGAATRLAHNGSKLAPAMARMTGILNASANYADTSASLDQAHTLGTEWDNLTPGQRAQMALSIAFWGGMAGVSAKASGGKLSDMFSFRAQMNSALIATGAAVRPNPAMAAGHAQVNTGYDVNGKLNIGVEYGPGTSEVSIDIHRNVARSLIDNSGAQGVIRRAMGDGVSFKPGTRGEEIALEIAKHEALVRTYDEHIQRAPSDAQPALKAERDAYANALRQYEAELQTLQKTGAEDTSGVGYIAAKALSDAYVTTPGLVEGLLRDGYFVKKNNPDHLLKAMNDVSDELGDAVVHQWRPKSDDRGVVHKISANNDALEMHSDGFADAEPSSLLILGCENPSLRGGANLLSDGIDIQAALTPQEIQRLREGVTFRKSTTPPRTGVFNPMPEGNGEMIRFRTVAEVTDEARPAWEKLLRVIEDNTIEVQLAAGDILIIDNKRMLHGRTAIEQGERLMHRTWVNTDDPNLGIQPDKVDARRRELSDQLDLLKHDPTGNQE